MGEWEDYFDYAAYEEGKRSFHGDPTGYFWSSLSRLPCVSVS